MTSSPSSPPRQNHESESGGPEDRPIGVGLSWVSLIYFVVYLLTHQLDAIVRGGSAPTGLSIAHGISLAALLLFGPRLGPVVLGAHLLGAWLSLPADRGILTAALLTTFHVGVLCAAAFYITGVSGRRVRLMWLKDVIAFIVVTSIASLLQALGESSARLWTGGLDWTSFFHFTMNDWLFAAGGLLTVTPFLLLHYRFPGRLRPPAEGEKTTRALAQVEEVLQALAVAGIVWIVFFWEQTRDLPPGYLCFLPIIWVSVRHGIRGATVAVLAVNLAAIASDVGPSTSVPVSADLLMLIVTLSLTGLLLGAAVTQRKFAEEKLGVETAYLEQLFENSPEAVVVVDNQSRIMRANAEFSRMFGYTLKEAAGRRVDELIVPPDFRDEALTLTSRIAHEENIGLETVRCHKDGTLINVSILGTPIHVRGGRVAVYGIYRDITHRRGLEDQLRQSQKMEAIGRLAGGVAHDFNNLLTAILGYSELLLEHEDASPRAGYLDEIRKAANRAKSLTTQLLAFSRKQILSPRIIEMGDIVTNIEPMLCRLLGENVQLQTRISLGPNRVKADPGQLEQVIVNLAVNARDALPEGGQIKVRVEPVELDEEYCRNRGALPGKYISLSFRDNGTGMSPDTRKRIFEPFYTTKDQGKGTGLGLSTVYGIVKQSGGYIDVESELGKGAVFTMLLPQVQAEPAPAAPAEQAESEGLLQTVLIVEDEEGLRALVKRILVRRGFRVLEASDGTQALMVSESYGSSIHLLLTDVVMPQMSGRVLANRLKARQPAIQILYMSGYTDVQDDLSSGETNFLQKPFTPDLLLEKVTDMLTR